MEKNSLRQIGGVILIAVGLSFWFSPFFAGAIFIAAGLTLIFGKEFWPNAWERIKGLQKKANSEKKNHNKGR